MAPHDLLMAEGEQYLLKAHLPTQRRLLLIAPLTAPGWVTFCVLAIQEFLIYYENDLKYWTERKY